MYAYLRSQEGLDQQWATSSGLFLHPAIGSQFYEHATIQGHSFVFATVDLAGSAPSVQSNLRRILRSGLNILSLLRSDINRCLHYQLIIL